MGRSYRQLTLEERCEISRLYEGGKSDLLMFSNQKDNLLVAQGRTSRLMLSLQAR